LANKCFPESKIFAFEPVSATYAQLVQNTNAFSNISAIPKGLYKENLTKEILLFDSNTHASIVKMKGSRRKVVANEEIQLIKGDDFVKSQGIGEVDFLKIDIEGAEFDALLGFQRTIEEGKIRAIQFEYGPINITTKKLLIDYYEFFQEKGYMIGKIFPKVVEFRPYDFKYEDFLGPNFIAVKESETALIEALSNVYRRGVTN
jgi:FkbM family methyltransferase